MLLYNFINKCNFFIHISVTDFLYILKIFFQCLLGFLFLHLFFLKNKKILAANPNRFHVKISVKKKGSAESFFLTLINLLLNYYFKRLKTHSINFYKNLVEQVFDLRFNKNINTKLFVKLNYIIRICLIKYTKSFILHH